MGDLSFATPKTPRCCGKPRGCMIQDGCAFLRHPWKRAMLFGEPTAPCPVKGFAGGVQARCVLLNGHTGACEMTAR